MKIKINNRNSFYLCGYMTETCLVSCKEDLDALWRTYESKKENLFQLFGRKKDFYGLMWYTQSHRYCYLIGIEVSDDKKTPKGAVCKHVPSSLYAVAAIPAGTPATNAWTEFFEVALPSLGYRPDAEHGLYFEHYPSGENEDYELWTPVIKKTKH
jgi:AraC family transcriptional regulator